MELATTVKFKFVQGMQPVRAASEDARVRETSVALKNAALPAKKIQRRYGTEKETNTSPNNFSLPLHICHRENKYF